MPSTRARGALGEELNTQTRAIAERIATRTQQAVRRHVDAHQRVWRSAGLAHATGSPMRSTRKPVRCPKPWRSAPTSCLTRSARAPQQISTAIEGQGATFDARVTEAMTTVVRTLGEQSNQVTTLIDGKVAEINANLGGGVDAAVSRLGDVESGLTARLGSVSSKIVESAREAAQSIESSVEHARTSITDMVGPASGHPARGDHRPRRHHRRPSGRTQSGAQHLDHQVDGRPRSRCRPYRGNHLDPHFAGDRLDVDRCRADRGPHGRRRPHRARSGQDRGPPHRGFGRGQGRGDRRTAQRPPRRDEQGP